VPISLSPLGVGAGGASGRRWTIGPAKRWLVGDADSGVTRANTVIAAHGEGTGATGDRSQRHNAPVDLERMSWLTTALACLLTAAILLVQGYVGYAGVSFAVAVSAAINLK
jgi:hypothetical protein